jgi:integrase
MAKALTEIGIRNAKPKRRHGKLVATETPDGGCRGLYLITQPSGSKSWACRYRFSGRTRKLTLGSVAVVADAIDGLTLAAARKAATEALHTLAKGIDPAASRAPRHTPATETFRDVAEGCLARENKRLRSAARQLHDLHRLVFPALGSMPIAAIKRSDVVRLLDTIEADKGPVMADAMLSTISKIMRDHARRSDDYVPVIVPGMRRSSPKERARDRILNDAELRAVWTVASDESRSPFGVFVRFLLLTAARRNEAARMVWAELSGGGTWTLPASRSKTKQPLVRPLSRLAQALLAKLPRGSDSDYVFRSVVGRPVFTDFWTHKRRLDAASGTSDWRLHDLRRTSRSLLSRAGVPDNHAERCLGHVIGGVKGVYDRHKYQAEMSAAYEKLATLIDRIIGPGAKIVTLRS